MLVVYCHDIPTMHAWCLYLIGGLEYDFYDFPCIGNNDPN